MLKSLFRSFRFAVDGCFHALQRERNLKLFVAACSLVIAGGILFELSLPEWMPVIICIGAFLAVELLNTALEVLADAVDEKWRGEKPDYIVSAIGRSKDIAAGAALIIGITGTIVIAMVFVPRLVEIW